jgi:hypothetical protein
MTPIDTSELDELPEFPDTDKITRIKQIGEGTLLFLRISIV